MDDRPLLSACVFDAYGTIFDFSSAVTACGDGLAGRAAELTALWRDKQLQYSWLRTLQGRYVDFWQVTCDALDYALDAIGVLNPAVRERLMSLYLELDVYPDVEPCLRLVKEAGWKTAILSNGSPSMLNPLVRRSRLGPFLDAVISVDDVGVFKTHPAAYQLAVDRLGVRTDEILFVSSNAWDAYAASDFGMRVAWCNRSGQRPERLPGRPDWDVHSLAELEGVLLT